MMTAFRNEVDGLDSQILTENVTFLNDCFDNTFTLQNSLSCVKEYIAEVQPNTSLNKSKALSKPTCSSNSCEVDSTINESNIRTQYNESSKLLRNWGLPEEITRKYEERGIIQMFKWQVSCLCNSKVLEDNSNLVYSAPTSAGKTLVAEILTIKTILERQKKVIIILPFVSIVREKMFYLQDILSSSGIRVEGFMGSQSPPGGLQAVHVAICTIEKANSLLNRLLDENNISELGAIIVDELHLLGDPHRGYILELLLTKVKYISSKLNIQIQIVGMSATLPNLEELAKWLDAELFITDFRPIPLDEFCLIGNKFYDKHGEYINSITHPDPNIDSDNILNICLDTIKDGCSILIFCMTKNRCENLAQNIASSFYKLGSSPSESGSILREQLKSENIVEVLEQLKNCPVGLDTILKNVISFGVAYHHAGLTFDERDIIEGAFKSGALRVLVATSTLSSGVNLPARKVIIRSPMFQRQVINILTYKQMIGRAGRMGKDTKGESILICTEAERKAGFELMSGTLSPVKSCIDSEDKYMRSMLEMIASEDVCSRTELELYSKCTLLYTQKLLSDNLLLEDTLKELINFELIRKQTNSEEECYVATALGKACLSSSMAPNDGLSLFCELQKARQCLVLETDLHLIYLVTPYSVSSQWSDIDWLHLLTLWESLTKAMKRVGELVGVQESFIIRSLRGTRNAKSCPKTLNIHKRFYTALALQDLVNEVPLSEVAVKFQCARGFLQGLQQAAATFAGMVTAFCRQLGWKNMEMLISQFQDRLHFGIHSELIELMKLSSLNSKRARALFDYGFESISSIASADVQIIENIFHKAVPFQSEKKRDDDDDIDFKKRNDIRNIWITGCRGMTPREAANILILEARKHLQLEIGVTEIKWENNINSNNNIITSNKTLNPVVNESHKIESNTKTDGNDMSCTVNKVVGLESSCNIKESKNPKDIDIPNQEVDRDLKKLYHDIGDSKKLRKKTLENDSHTTTINESNFSLQNIDMVKEKENLPPVCGQNNNCNFPNLLKNEFEVFLQSTDMQNKLNISNPNTELKVEKDNITSFLHGDNGKEYQKSKEDENLWDSLSFTDTAIQNISKPRSSDTLFSPNISIGEVEIKTNVPNNSSKDLSKTLYNSSKDVSLFSSDAENSFLDESFSANSKLNIDEGMSKDKNGLSANTTDYINSDTILNAFKSSVSEPEDEDEIKLIYEEENDLIDDLKNAFITMDTNEVENTQSKKEISVKHSFISPLKRPSDASDPGFIQSSKSKKSKTNKQDSSCLIGALSLNFKESKYVGITFSNYKLDCYILNESDIFRIEQIIERNNHAAMILDIGMTTPVKNNFIGMNCLRSGPKHESILKCDFQKISMKSITLCFKQNVCFYIDLMSFECNNTIQAIKSTLSKWLAKKYVTLRILSLKSNYNNIKRCCLHNEISARWRDVALKEWLIDSDTRISNIFDLALKYCKLDLANMDVKLNGKKKRFKDLAPAEDMCLRAWSIWEVAEQQERILLQQYNKSNTINDLEDIETHVLKILADSEQRGITVDKALASQLLIDVKKSQEILQMKAFKMTGHHFNFNSSKSVAKVLGLYKGRKISTKKSVLTAHCSPLASIIIFWRKLNSILTKTLYPLTEKACAYSSDNRITPSYTMFTCTGRISMHEPNLQNVPRTFSVPLKYLAVTDSECDDVMEFNCRNVFRAAPGHVFVSADYCQLEMRILTHYSADPVLTRIMSSDADVFKSIASSWSGVLEEEYLAVTDSECSDVMEFNCRNVFRAALGYVFVSADYCQLEMRILTHYSADPVLTRIMSSDVDVFKSIASSWSGVLEEEVDDDLRQKAKQLCYGIIYGMGNKTLAQNLEVTEAEAAVFMDTFYKTYPAIREFTNKVLEDCRTTGYVETLKKRRRYLPDINSLVGVKRSAAERQAVNTMIQGSAADIAKAAMCAIDNRTNADPKKPGLVLQMHDELIYEVPEDKKFAFIATIKEVMEGTIHLNVPLPVKVKTGPTWGSLEEVKI